MAARSRGLAPASTAEISARSAPSASRTSMNCRNQRPSAATSWPAPGSGPSGKRGAARSLFAATAASQIHHARVDRQSLPPPLAPEARAELESDRKRRHRIVAGAAERDRGLGEHQGDVPFQSLAQAAARVRRDVGARADVHPDVAAADLDRERAHVVRPGVERAAAGQVEARVMPVAGQDAVAHRAAVQREAHVRAPVVQGVDAVAVREERDRVPVELGDDAAGRPHVGERGGADELAARLLDPHGAPPCPS
jgi:hypothetical protein